jgi:cytochrome P450
LAEILRFNGFNRFFSRTPTENTVVGKYTIPKDALVLFSVDTVHFDDDYFKESNKFNPDRFLTKDGEFTGNNRNFTFGLGKTYILFFFYK